MNAKERFIEYVEFAAKYDIRPALDMKARQLSTLEFYNIDSILILSFTFAITSYFSFKFIGYIVQKLLNRIRKTKTE